MKETLSAAHSILCTKSLKSYAERHYDFGELSECKFIQLGLNDTYLIRTKTEKFILRAYRLNWRTESDIAYELDSTRWEEIIRSFEEFGNVHVIVSNGATTLEAFGQFGKFSNTDGFFNVQSKSLDMHIRSWLLYSPSASPVTPTGARL